FTDTDVQMLLKWVSDNREKAGDNMLFQEKHYDELATSLNTTCTKGKQKSARSCKNKWQAVCFVCLCRLLLVLTLRHIDPHTGAHVTAESDAPWRAYCKVCHTENISMAPFRNKGWEWWEDMIALMPTRVRGANV
ncbi:hypothetical protein PUNSTDRAFT_36074, partial [Punctularia strigosozonata HHB-11173 SS5]|uniref:uncharacterized protein n=1 Tax=Punctularia strigosozonata (strain HHB-11173) TaxID=741275 RepID=UPI0004416ABD